MENFHTSFRDGKLPMESTRKTKVLIYKGNGEFRRIRLVEVL